MLLSRRCTSQTEKHRSKGNSYASYHFNSNDCIVKKRNNVHQCASFSCDFHCIMQFKETCHDKNKDVYKDNLFSCVFVFCFNSVVTRNSSANKQN